MHKPCIALTAMTGGALLAALFTAPAWADPTTPQCFQAQANVASQQNNVEKFTNQLSNDNVTLQNAKDKLALDQAAVPVDPDRITQDQTAVSDLQTTVNKDQASLATAQRNLTAAVATRDAACASTPAPTTTPVPPPVGGTVVYPTCVAAFRAGAHDILRSDPRYRIYLDRDRDGIACELNGQDNPQPPVVRPAPTTVVPGPVIQGSATVIPGPVFNSPAVPSGPVATGDGSLAYLMQ